MNNYVDADDFLTPQERKNMSIQEQTVRIVESVVGDKIPSGMSIRNSGNQTLGRLSFFETKNHRQNKSWVPHRFNKGYNVSKIRKRFKKVKSGINGYDKSSSITKKSTSKSNGSNYSKIGQTVVNRVKAKLRNGSPFNFDGNTFTMSL